MKHIVIIASIISIVGCSSPSKTVFPKDEWIKAKPEDVGINSKILNEAVGFLEQNSGKSGIHELMIVRHGRLIYSGDSIYKVHGVWSCTKSFTSTVLGLLIDDNKAQLSTLAKEIIPGMSELYPDVSLLHFTTMTSGYVALGDTVKTGYTHGPSGTPFTPGKPPLFEPGAKYAYWDAAMNQFANLLTHIAQEPLDEYFKNRIADPIGMKEKGWYWGDFGEVNGLKVVGGAGNRGNGVYISASEFARFGLLFLNRGNWDGKQLMSGNWIEQATRVQVPSTMELGTHWSSIYGMGVYGYNWWVNGARTNGIRLWENAPSDTYAASGYNNNKMIIIPEWDMVIVRLGLDANDVVITDDTWNEFLEIIGNSL